jgi:hypothetical protein
MRFKQNEDGYWMPVDSEVEPDDTPPSTKEPKTTKPLSKKATEQTESGSDEK